MDIEEPHVFMYATTNVYYSCVLFRLSCFHGYQTQSNFFFQMTFFIFFTISNGENLSIFCLHEVWCQKVVSPRLILRQGNNLVLRRLLQIINCSKFSHRYYLGVYHDKSKNHSSKPSTSISKFLVK